MRNVFILEDDPNRCFSFIKYFIKDNVTLTNNAERAVHLLQNVVYDVILLDHDLGGEVYVDPTEPNTGSRVCRELTLNNMLLTVPLNMNTQFIIHSMNNTASIGMMNTLISKGFKNVVYCPFSKELFDRIERTI